MHLAIVELLGLFLFSGGGLGDIALRNGTIHALRSLRRVSPGYLDSIVKNSILPLEDRSLTLELEISIAALATLVVNTHGA